MATVTEAVKESLVGFSKPQEMSLENRQTWVQYAKKDENGELYMDTDTFIEAIAPPGEDYHKIPRERYRLLFLVADRNKAGRIKQDDFALFHSLLSRSDAPEYLLLFRLFDQDNEGVVKVDKLQKIYDQYRGKDGLPFDFKGAWASLYFGAEGKRHDMTYDQFAQMIRGLQGERIRQAFQHYDTDKDGMITPDQFATIIRDNQGHKLSDHVLEHLPTLCNIQNGANITYPVIRAFLNITREMDLLDLIIRNATRKSSDGRIDKREFLEEAQRVTRFSQYTPLEAEILFHFASLDNPSGRLSIWDFSKVLDSSYRFGPRLEGFTDKLDEAASAGTSFFHGFLKSAHHFGLGSIAGALGAFVVYPIDLVKTRMQNQRSGAIGHARLYDNSIDCARKIIRNEGFRGLYAGLPPQLVGVAPEKAIKLTVNEMLRKTFKDPQSGAISFPLEMVSGGSAGACQVIFTNPLEIVKIRLQVQGELAKKSDAVPRRSAMWIVKNLGIMGLYKGAGACLLRDVPFSAIYFPTYAHMKKDVFGESETHKIGILQLITAGAIAGIPAAYLTTPADVIKTRLQVEARKGDATYNGLTDCARKIFRDEGFKAFFKGGPARIIRSSPQFGVTLASFEVLSGAFPLPASIDPDAHKSAGVADLEPGIGLREAKAPLPFLRCRNALKLMLDIDKDFGRIKAPENMPWAKK